MYHATGNAGSANSPFGGRPLKQCLNCSPNRRSNVRMEANDVPLARVAMKAKSAMSVRKMHLFSPPRVASSASYKHVGRSDPRAS